MNSSATIDTPANNQLGKLQELFDRIYSGEIQPIQEGKPKGAIQLNMRPNEFSSN